MKTSIIGFPRVGAARELKFACEKYFRGELSEGELCDVAHNLRLKHWETQRQAGIGFIPSNDFSLYDNLLDTAVMLGIVPARYEALGLTPLDEYFAMARGYQGPKGDVKALSMKKWFNTNYHYMVAEIEDDAQVKLNPQKVIDEFNEAKEAGLITKPCIIGPFTFLKLARYVGRKSAADFVDSVVEAYAALLGLLVEEGAEWVEFDEPYLVRDLTTADIDLFTSLYNNILVAKGGLKVLLQTYFGDIRDAYNEVVNLNVDAVGLDFVEGRETMALLKANGFPKDKLLVAGLVNGKNIWRNNYNKTMSLLDAIHHATDAEVAISTSCSLLHVPYTTKSETQLPADKLAYFAFADEKVAELATLANLATGDLESNQHLWGAERGATDIAVQQRVAALRDSDFTRSPVFEERERIQRDVLCLPLLPTTTIGSFPQTAEVRVTRSAFKKGKITAEEYRDFNRRKIADCVTLQERIGLDVLVHGEFERNDMVEYFGECLDGFLFTEKAWVQSYGTRCVKPPVVWGDVKRSRPMTVDWSVYAQSLTDKPMKGMLTGPVTILNWSFPREDISLKECAYQIALAIRDEVLDLEQNGIKIIQVDEAALREKLPLRRADWDVDYLDWAIPAFRLVHSGVKSKTQMHTHMCYSEFNDIIRAIDNMDADVISFEASRSDLTILNALKKADFHTQVGPGVYDIHSPRVPSVEEIEKALQQILERIDARKLWVNPDCGLKTRGEKETVSSLQNLKAATDKVRIKLTGKA